jgi:L-asparagine oxygenase
MDVLTYFVHSGDIFGPEAELTLKRALFRPRRRLDGRLTCFRLREGECHRWDPAFILPVNSLASELRSRVLERIASTRIEPVPLKAKGDCILVDNWKTLHGRSVVTRDGGRRRIERVYLTSIKL